MYILHCALTREVFYTVDKYFLVDFVDKYFLVDLVEYLRIKSIKKQIPKSISNRISNISSNNERFGHNINVYKENLKKVAFMMIRFVRKNHLLTQKAAGKGKKLMVILNAFL